MTKDSAVHAALEAADRRDRMSRLALIAAAVLEAILLGLALMVMDFADDTHKLILITAVLVYTTLALGMMAIAARGSAAHARLLHAIQLLDDERRA